MLFLAFACLSAPAADAQDLSCLTYNIRFDNPGDGEDRWDLRKDFLADQVRWYAPTVMGTQEGLHHQVVYLDSVLADYAYLGVGRDDGAQAGEYCALFYRTDELEVLESGTFWLSPTPERPSKGWDAAIVRICTWARFAHRAKGTEFWVFNTHFDHVGRQARVESARLIHQKVMEKTGGKAPTVIMGDLNLTPETEPIQIFGENWADARTHAALTLGPEGTFTGFDSCTPAERRIDYIFVHPDLYEVQRYLVLSDRRNGHYASDHFGVYAELRRNEE